MAFQPPPEWEQYINGFGSPFQPIDLSVPPTLDQQQFALPGELSKGTVDPAPPPPPPPPQTIAAPGVPVQDEVPQGAVDVPVDAAPQEQPPLLNAPDQLQTPPMLNVDAVSGGMLPEQQFAYDQAQHTGAPVAGQTSGVPQMPDEYLTDDEFGQKLSTLPIEQQEAYRRKVEEPKEKMLAAGKLEADTQRLRDAENSARIYQDSVRDAQERAKQLDIEARQIADENPLDSISGGRKIMGVLASIVGGFMANKTGRNMGLEAVDQIANDAMQLHAQKLQLNARQQAGIGDQIARAGDVSKASEAVRLAVYDGAIKQLETKVQDFDPRGTTALRVMDDINALKQRRADALQKYFDGEQKRLEDQRKYELDAMKVQQEQQRIAETARNNKAQIGLGYSRIAQDERQSKRSAELEQKKLDAQTTKDLATKAQAEEKEMRELGVSAPPTASFDADGNLVVTKSTGYLKNADGKEWKIPLADEAKEFRKKKAAADAIVYNLDQLRQLREDVGGESSVWNSDAYQRAQVIKNNLIILKKAGTQGMSSDEDMNKIIAALGAKDPTSFRAQMASLDEGRAQVEKQLNIEAQALHYNGDAITYPDPLKMRKATKTPEQEQVETITSFDPKRSLIARDYQDLGIDTTGVAARGGGLATLEIQALEREGGVPPRIKAQINALRDAANSGDPKKREFAVEALANIARDALDPNVRAYATANAFDPAAIAGPASSPEEEPR